MVGKVFRSALVRLFGAPHCGGCDIHLNCPRLRCALSAVERKRVFIERQPWPCDSPRR